MELNAEETARSLRQVDAELQVAPGLQVTDNLSLAPAQGALPDHRSRSPWRSRRRAGPGSSSPTSSTRACSCAGPCSAACSSSRRTAPIEDLEPEEAARRPELASSGRILPDTQARRIQDAYQYKGGIWNAWFVHEDQTQITDTDTNPQPYLVDFGGDLGTQWVTVAEPYGRAFAASVVFLTDTETGRTRIWRVPRETSLSGNRRAIEAVRAVSIPGIDFGDGTIGSGNFRVVEPRPVFVDDRLVLLTSIIPNTANAVSKTVVVDAETNKLVAIFDNDRDPQSEEKTQRYIATGEVPDDAAQPGAPEEATTPEEAHGRRTGTPAPSGRATRRTSASGWRT